MSHAADSWTLEPGAAAPQAVDRRFMAEAFQVAAAIPERPWPNPPVGALLVLEGEVVGRGAHLGPGRAHAERVALDEAAERARGATLYCTLEPCNHQGRTPPCAPAVVASGVARVVIGVLDPNPRVAGGGYQALRAAGIEVSVGVQAAACLELIWPFVVTEAFARPYLELKTARSLDGRFSLPQPADSSSADQPSGPVYLTSEEARRDVHRRRRWVDLVLVGEGTARADHPRLDTRLVPAEAACPAAEPAAGYVDTDLSHQAGLGRVDHFVFHGTSAAVSGTTAPLQSAAVQHVACAVRDGHVDPADLLQRAAALGLQTIMLEGGPQLAAAFLSAGLVDRWIDYRAPLVAGGGATWPAEFPSPLRTQSAAFSLTQCAAIGADLLTIHDRCDFAATLRRLASHPGSS